MKNKKTPIVIVILGLLLIIPTLFIDSEPNMPAVPADLKGVFIDSPSVSLPEFEFVDHNGEAFRKENFLGKWSLVFFGYTNCPDESKYP